MNEVTIHPAWIERQDMNGLDGALALARHQDSVLTISGKTLALRRVPRTKFNTLVKQIFGSTPPCAA